MKWKKLVAVTVIVALLVGASGHIAVSRAATLYSLTTVPVYWQAGTIDSGNSLFLATSSGANFTYRDVATITKTLTVDGVPYTNFEWGMNVDPIQDGLLLIHNFFVVFGLGIHTIIWNCDSNPGPWEMNYTSEIALNIVVMPPVSWAPIGEGVYTPPPAFSVSIAGPSTAAVGVPTSLGVVIVGGAAPYQEQWTVFADRNGTDYSGSRSSSNVNFSHVYLATSAYQVRVKVWDSIGAEAEAVWTMNGQSQKPVMHGQLLLNGAAGQMLDFGMYTDANSDPEAVVAWSSCVPTSDYVVTWPEVTLTAESFYQLLTASAYPNPLVVTTRYTEANGQQWTYSFSFDTTNLTGPGTYINSYGDSGTIEAGPPTWLQGTLNWLFSGFKDLFKWAFVPTTAQMENLMPGGSLGTALLDQTSWGTGSGSWNLTVHAAGFAIPLVNIDFATINSWSFVTVIRTGIQAVMCVGLVYMIVTLL